MCYICCFWAQILASKTIDISKTVDVNSCDTRFKQRRLQKIWLEVNLAGFTQQVNPHSFPPTTTTISIWADVQFLQLWLHQNSFKDRNSEAKMDKMQNKKQVTCVINTALSWQVSHNAVLIFFENVFYSDIKAHWAQSKYMHTRVSITRRKSRRSTPKYQNAWWEKWRGCGGGGLSCIRVTVVNLPVETGTFSIIEF